MQPSELSVTERCVGKVWSSVLNVPVVGSDQNFFELGGDSISMIEMLFKLSAELQMEVDPGLLFEEATLRGFCQLIDSAKSQAGTP